MGDVIEREPELTCSYVIKVQFKTDKELTEENAWAFIKAELNRCIKNIEDQLGRRMPTVEPLDF